jgi:hypothetical protein
MSLNKAAEENLLVIRTLMERATVYRAVSTQVAAWAGLLSVSAYGVHSFFQKADLFLDTKSFLVLWGSVFGLTIAGNFFFLIQESKQRGQSRISPAFRKALLGVFPAYLMGAIFTLLLWSAPFKEVIFWLIFYGLGLLGTQHFAPRSMIVLGWFFILTGGGIMAYMSLWGVPDPSALVASTVMALTFGGYHLIYAGVLHFSPKLKSLLKN